MSIHINAARLVAVKSNQHFHAGFAPVAAEIIYVGGPGAMGLSFAAIRIGKSGGPFSLKDANSFQMTRTRATA